MKARIIAFTALFCSLAPSLAYGLDQQSFYPTWKLLSNEAKEQFIAGYLEGWRDAATVTDIATEYVKENPQKAVEGLQKIRALYDLSSFKAAAIAQEIDQFYKDPGNNTASLSKAVSFAKNALSR